MTQSSLGLSDAAFLEKDPAELLAEETASDTEAVSYTHLTLPTILLV